MAPSNAVQQPSSFADEPQWGACVAILAAVAVCTLLGAAVDAWLAKRRASKDTKEDHGVRCWALGMLISSYSLLFPGLFLKLFESRSDLIVFGIEQNLSTYDETMESLISRLWREGMPMGSILVALYSMAIPGLKMFLLAIGLALRHGSARQVGWARLCIRVVQAISKWSCPDMFAYILLTYLMRGLNKPPTIKSSMELELGFICFCMFCIASTFSSLGIRLPELPIGDVEEIGAEQLAKAPESQTAALEASAEQGKVQAQHRVGGVCRLCHSMAVPTVVILSASFFALLATGLRTPSMSLQLDMSLLYTVRPDLAALKAILDPLNLDQLLYKEVGVWQCMLTLVTWIGEGEVNAVIAFILYAVFAVSLPIVDMCLTLWLAALAAFKGAGSASASTALALSRKVQKLAMLDVSVMGSFVVVAALASQRENGVIVEARAGCALLLGAEACRQLASLIVRHALAATGSAETKALKATKCTPACAEFICADTPDSQSAEASGAGVESDGGIAAAV